MTKISKKIGKMWKDMTGVSPIIAVILMVAITVVLAATIYVWVSGFGGSGSSTPAISMSADNVNDKLIVTSCDPGINWTDISIKASVACDGNLTTDDNNAFGSTYHNITTYFKKVGGTYLWPYANGHSGIMHAGDEIKITSGSGAVSITLRYDPTDSILGTWTVYV